MNYALKRMTRELKMILKKILRRKKTPKYSKSIFPSSQILNGMVAYNKYGGYFTPTSSQHRVAVQKVLRGKVYEPDTINFIRKNCKSGDIIHAGAFFGDFLPGLSLSLSKNAKIWAFEPNTENFRCAQITIQINNLNNVNLFNCGLGENKSVQKMLIESEKGASLGGASRIIQGNHQGKTIKVSIMKVDEMVPNDRHISILQLDVEGYEKEALSGALVTIHRCKPIIILEDNNKIIDTHWFKEKILNIGYQEKGKLHSNTLFMINEYP